jgi:hypothetical protein
MGKPHLQFNLIIIIIIIKLQIPKEVGNFYVDQQVSASQGVVYLVIMSGNGQRRRFAILGYLNISSLAHRD